MCTHHNTVYLFVQQSVDAIIVYRFPGVVIVLRVLNPHLGHALFWIRTAYLNLAVALAYLGYPLAILFALMVANLQNVLLSIAHSAYV